jgi:hypothetical protein
MGGPGSGNFDRGKKETVEDSLCLNANYRAREGIIRAGPRLTGSRRWTYHSGRSLLIDYALDTLDLDRPSVWMWYSWVVDGYPEAGRGLLLGGADHDAAALRGLRWWFPVVAGPACTPS